MVARYSATGGPVVAAQPVTTPVSAGETLTLTATPINGLSNLSVQWQRNGVSLNDGPGGASPGGGTVSGASATLASPTFGSTATLTIANVTPGDSGDYQAIFTNACGSVSTAGVAICVSVPCAADFNVDGGIDGSDIEAFILTWEAGGCAADVNEDGGVDGGDVETFFVTWEAGEC
jgi:hypothetical protein